MKRSALRLRARTGRRGASHAVPIGFAILGIALVFGFILSVSLGSVSVPFAQTVKILVSKITNAPASGVPEMHETIITRIRVPRVLLGMLVGAALSLSGLVFQALQRAQPLIYHLDYHLSRPPKAGEHDEMESQRQQHKKPQHSESNSFHRTPSQLGTAVDWSVVTGLPSGFTRYEPFRTAPTVQ